MDELPRPSKRKLLMKRHLPGLSQAADQLTLYQPGGEGAHSPHPVLRAPPALIFRTCDGPAWSFLDHPNKHLVLLV